MLESTQHTYMRFVTLTYDDTNLPDKRSLSLADMQKYFKRLRKRVEPATIRYYYVGEYGDHTERPHYHAVLFGPASDSDIDMAWKLGHVHFGDVNRDSIQYCCSHITKSALKFGDPRLDGRHPEFARMSRRPYGIGYGALDELATWLYTGQGAKWLVETGDVISVIRMQGQLWPLGGYLVRKLRELMDRSPCRPDAAKQADYERRVAELFGDPDAVPLYRDVVLSPMREQKRKHSALKAEFRLEKSNLRKKL